MIPRRSACRPEAGSAPRRQPESRNDNSLHVVCGALVLTGSLVLTLRSWRFRFETVNLARSVRLPLETRGRQG